MNLDSSVGVMPFVRKPRRITEVESYPASPSTLDVPEATRFEEHCDEEFRFLASNEPRRLLELIENGLRDRPELLTFAAEAAGHIGLTPWVIEALLPLTGDKEAVVREGAIYGLIPHLERSIKARETLRCMAKGDPSPGVRSAAQDALSQLG
jgi:hypothetical protein